MPFAHCHSLVHAKEIGMHALYQEAAWIVMQVIKPSSQLPLPEEQLVVKAVGKKEAVGAVFVRHFACLS